MSGEKMQLNKLFKKDINRKLIKEEITVQSEDTILFIGDSITDVNRKREDKYDLGNGFPMLIAADLHQKFPHYHLNILNRGISGDLLGDLTKRWEIDCLEINPDIVTILIGINDVSFFVKKNIKPTEDELAQFEKDYRYLLKSLAQRTDAKVILIEPFVLPYPKERLTWREQLDPRIHIIRKLAKDYHALLIPLDGLLNAKGIATDYKIYTGEDGIHPTLTGHAEIVSQWLKTLKI